MVREIVITIVSEEGDSREVRFLVDPDDTETILRLVEFCLEYADGGLFYISVPEDSES